MLSLSMTFYLFSTAFRSWGSVERGPTYFTYLLQIPVHHHSGIYSPILPLEEGHRIQAYSWYPYLVQQITPWQERLVTRIDPEKAIETAKATQGVYIATELV